MIVNGVLYSEQMTLNKSDDLKLNQYKNLSLKLLTCNKVSHF